MRIALAWSLALAACSQPCPYVCSADSDCPLGSFCASHQCLRRCILCGGACVKDTFDNCETCGVPCATGQVCSAGKCSATCATGFMNCSGSCYDLENDRLNCGACGHICANDQGCSGGACQTVSC